MRSFCAAAVWWHTHTHTHTAHLLYSVVDLPFWVIAAYSLQSCLAIRLGKQILRVDSSHVARVTRDEVAFSRRLWRRELSIRDKLAPLERVVVGLPLCQRRLADVAVGLSHLVLTAWQEASVALPAGEQRQQADTHIPTPP